MNNTSRISAREYKKRLKQSKLSPYKLNTGETMEDDKSIIDKLRALKEFESVVKQQRKSGKFDERRLKLMLKQKKIKFKETLGIDLNRKTKMRKKISKSVKKKTKVKKFKKGRIQEKVKSNMADKNTKKIVKMNGFMKVKNPEVVVPLAKGLSDLQNQIKQVGDNILRSVIMKTLRSIKRRDLVLHMFQDIEKNFSKKTNEECQKFLYGRLIFNDKLLSEEKIDFGVQVEIEKEKESFKNHFLDVDGGETCDDLTDFDLGFVDEDRLRESER